MPAKLIASALLLVHSWYPSECCADKDCHPVPCSEIARVQGGYQWVHAGAVVQFAGKPRMSPDDQCHVCVHESVTPSGLCVFLAPQT